MEQFYTLLTDVGKAKIANATALQTKVKFSKILVGDGNGSYYEPTETQTKLKNKVWEGGIGNISIDKDNPNWIILESVIPSSIGGFTIREVGIEDSEGDLVVIAKYPQTYKPKIADGSTKDLIIKTILEVTNVDTITLKVDPTIILATKKDIENVEQKVDIKLKTVDTTVEKLNSNNKEFITKITNTEKEIDKNKKELDKKVQDFIDTKGQENGIASLGADGKVSKEQLPNLDKGGCEVFDKPGTYNWTVPKGVHVVQVSAIGGSGGGAGGQGYNYGGGGNTGKNGSAGGITSFGSYLSLTGGAGGNGIHGGDREGEKGEIAYWNGCIGDRPKGAVAGISGNGGNGAGSDGTGYTRVGGRKGFVGAKQENVTIIVIPGDVIPITVGAGGVGGAGGQNYHNGQNGTNGTDGILTIVWN